MGEADRAKYKGRKCPECGLPIAACNEIAQLKLDILRLQFALGPATSWADEMRTKDDEVAKLQAEVNEHRDLGLTYHRQAVGLKDDNDKLRAALENAEQFLDLYVEGAHNIKDARHTLAHISQALTRSNPG